MGWASNVDLEQREMFEQDADELNEEDFIAKHGEFVRFQSSTLKSELTVNAREWYKAHKFDLDEPWFTA